MTGEEIRNIGDALGEYVWKNHVLPRLSGMVRFYRAEVVSGAAEGKIAVRRPFDAPVSLPYAGSAGELAEGDQCTVLVLGDASNAIVIGDGTLSNL